MKGVKVNFFNAKRVLITEENDCEDTIIYSKTAKKGQWMAQAVAVGSNLREACMNYIESGEADLIRLTEWWERFLKFDKLKPAYKQIMYGKDFKEGSVQYENAFNKWLNEYLSDELLFELLTNKDTMVAIDWSKKLNDRTYCLKERER